MDRDFVRVRLAAALALRETLFDTPYYRWVHAEADSLPGLVLDRYGSVIVGQANTATMRLLAPQIEAAVQDLVSPQAMIWRNDSPVSRLEGLEEEERMAFGQIPPILRSKRMAAISASIRKTARKPDGSSINATTAPWWPVWPRAARYWTSTASRAALG